MNPEDIKILERWKTRNQLSPTTYKTYKSVMQHYSTCCNQTLQELYNEAITEEEQAIPRYRRSIKNHILDYYNYLENQDFTETTKNNHIKVIRSFYKHLDVEVPDIQNKYEATPIPENNNKNITKDLIKVMISNATTRDKAILSIACMTGQSPDEIRNITIQQIINCYNTELETPLFTAEDILQNKTEILKLKAPRLDMFRRKTKNKYWVYLPSETTQHIINYLHERINGTNTKLRIQSNDDPLFVTKHGTKFTTTAVSALFMVIGERCGFENPTTFDAKTRLLLTRSGGEHRLWRAYNFRKYFINTCRRYAGTHEGTTYNFTGLELADFWVGHKVKGSIQHYIQYNYDDIDYMQQQYYQVLPYLSMEYDVQELTTKDKQEFLALKKQYETLSEELSIMKEYLESKAFVEQMQRQMKGDEK